MTATEHSGRSRRVGPYITVGTVVVVLAAACITLFGLGAFDRAVATYDPTAWLFSQAKGELGRVNGNTARVDTRVKVQGTAGHRVEVSQSNQTLIVRDMDTGTVSALNLATLQVAASLSTAPGLGVRVVVHGGTAYVLDETQGQVQQVDPRTLKPIGSVLSLAPGMVGGDFDSDGRMWLALPTQGTVVSVTPAAQPGRQPAVRTEAVTDPNHKLEVSVLDKGVAVLDQTVGQLVTVVGSKVTKANLGAAGQGDVPPRTGGDKVPVTMPGHQVESVSGSDVSQYSVPGSGSLDPAVAWAGWYYVPDNTSGQVYVLDQSGSLVSTIKFPGQPGTLQLQAQNDYLYINGQGGGTAYVVNKSHKLSSVNKYPNDVPGGDAPPAPPKKTPPPPPPARRTGPPGAPTSVVASAGNASAHLSWGRAPSNGSAIVRYVVDGGPKEYTVSADERSMDLSGLTNGKSYTFSVYAVNAKGSGPKAYSNPVVPTSAVPSAPASVSAQAQTNGGVAVSWSAGNGLGHKVASYQVTANGPSGPVQTWQVSGSKTSYDTPAGELDYGTQYAFTVTTVNDQGASSKASPLSKSVVPYTVPSAPSGVKATTGSSAGTVNVSWSQPADNGRAITGYVISYAGKSKTVSGSTGSTSLTGLGDGESVSVSVAAVNAAGTGAKSSASTASTIAAPTVTLGTSSVTYNDITVHFTVNDGGGTPSCTLSVSGAGSKSGSCTSLTVGGLAPGTTYTATVKATNEAGSASKSTSAKTTVLMGTVTCTNPPGDNYCTTIGIYTHPAQQTQYIAGTAPPGTRYQAYCQIAGGINTQTSNTTTINSAQYNNYKKSTKWIKISTGAKYIPYAWLNLDGGDDIGLLPAC